MRTISEISLILLILIMLSMIYSLTYAGEESRKLEENVLNTSANTKVTKPITGFAKSVIVITQIIGVGTALIMAIILGMKYMVSAPDDKAQIKKHAVVYVIGAVVLFGAAGILEIIKNFAGVTNS